MKRLTALQLAELKRALDRNHLHQALQTELLDHLAIEIETRMDHNQTYEHAMQQVMQEASPQALAQLKHSYQQSLGFMPTLLAPRRIVNLRYQHRQSTSKQLPIWLGASAFTFVVLMCCMMWVSQRFSVPLDVFKLAWTAGLLSLFAVFSVQLLLRPRSRRMRPRRA